MAGLCSEWPERAGLDLKQTENSTGKGGNSLACLGTEAGVDCPGCWEGSKTEQVAGGEAGALTSEEMLAGTEGTVIWSSMYWRQRQWHLLMGATGKQA